jgi:hypothetical protein
MFRTTAAATAAKDFGKFRIGEQDLDGAGTRQEKKPERWIAMSHRDFLSA